jgi:hypothetical protein
MVLIIVMLMATVSLVAVLRDTTSSLWGSDVLPFRLSQVLSVLA